MLHNYIYGLLGFGSLSILAFAHSCNFFVNTPQTGKVVTDPGNRATVRGGPAILWLGGGYQGGK